MSDNSQTNSTAHSDQAPSQAKKAWVTPAVSQSPVNEFTQASFAGSGADGGFYS
ncbi:hypothetical protein [Synechococcus sp. PCC 6312]|uniref:hypothetical protein n=1 Tax=Synechococcus sp. (strain ATCC 27167 / PCC 6312) TaxID=195253 RepID=UPI00029EF21C|nr:hypothetical protein [Synechococcus sp. PCC 6312]AFY62670.1 hypothetical protein Syn6312_3654 [Synechococcus sp. PCC 6312]